MTEFNYSSKKSKVLAQKEGPRAKTPSTHLSDKRHKFGDNTDCVGMISDLMNF